jgi:hypothetical protein
MIGTVGGSGRWRIFEIRKGHLQTFFQDPAQNFTQNMPTFREIAPGSQVEGKLNPNDGEWCNLGRCRNSYPSYTKNYPKTSFEPGDLIIVDYDVPAFPESLRLGVWWGVAAASTTVQ